jgi:hypothetical protein
VTTHRRFDSIDSVGFPAIHRTMSVLATIKVSSRTSDFKLSNATTLSMENHWF